ncbi:SMP-30/gluconolactonase/LRE family protein [Streptomyces sp. H27-D2]|uniref:SMP-30/gluconolactonase/LRE family protein n=1 Tax=Streptomyces sp. H27-D2 TaxID=3046304 RepID=UPI002DC03746|nr:superoxide dismutase [Streptomyces sp. H27-D2]MEC4016702.1 superoxide dismutase [Streptomyces sp. H27-D2]
MEGSFARRRLLGAGAALGGAALLGPLARTAQAAPTAPLDRSGGGWPTTIALPDGFQPEGIAIGSAPYAYFGSLADGSVYRASLATGRGSVISQGPGTPSVGLKLDQRGRLFIAGGDSREIRVVEVRSGKILATYRVGAEGGFVNDVILTPDAAWFTDSFHAQLYVLPLGRHGELPAPRAVRTLPLTGEWVQGGDFTANGIERTPDGRALLVVNAFAGAFFRVDPRSGRARKVPHTGPPLVNGDGVLLLGRTMYVVQQAQNAVDVLRLDKSGSSGEAVARITDARFRIPTTAAAYGKRIYLPNARFDIETPTPTTTYEAVAVRGV